MSPLSIQHTQNLFLGGGVSAMLSVVKYLSLHHHSGLVLA